MIGLRCCFILISLLFLASNPISAVQAIEFERETLISVDEDISRRVAANRNGQVATIYAEHRAVAGGDRIAYFGPDTSGSFELPGSRLLGINMSNWGVVTLNVGNPGAEVLAAPIGEPFETIFSTASSGSINLPGINDTGDIAFFSRETNSHPPRDAYLVRPGSEPELLPDLLEEGLYPPPMIDAASRIVGRHEFHVPEFRVELHRFDDSGNWIDIATGKLPERYSISNSVAVGGIRSMAPDGSFVFSARNDFEEPSRWELMLFDGKSDTITSIADHSSVDTDRSGNPYGMAVDVTFADDGSILMNAFRFEGIPRRQVWSRLRAADGSVVDLESLLPDDLELLAPNFAVMNYAGDVWFAGEDERRNRSYFLFKDGLVHTVLEDVPDILQNPVLTDDLDVYFWQTLPDDTSRFERISIVPEPNGLAIGFLLVCFQASIVRNACRRKKLRSPDSIFR